MKILKRFFVFMSWFFLTFLFSCTNSPEAYVKKYKKIMDTAFIKSKEEEKALKWLDKAIAEDPNYAPAYFERGMYYLEDPDKLSNPRDIYKALDDFHKYVILDPNNAEVWYLIMRHEKKSEKLLIATQKMLEIEPENPAINVYFGKAYMGLKDYIRAKKYFYLYLEANPEANHVYSDLGDIAKIEEEYYDAYEFYGKANSEYWQMIVIFYIKELASTGDKKAKKFLTDNKINKKSYINQAKELVNDGKTKEALAFLYPYVARIQEKSSAIAYICEYYAIIKFNSAIKGEFDTKGSNGGTLINSGRKRALEDVVRMCQKAVKNYGRYDAYVTMAEAYSQLGKDIEAERTFKIASKSKKSSPMIYYDMALINIRNREYSTAIKNINKVIDANGKSTTFLNLRARAYLAIAQKGKALDDLNESLELVPNNLGALEMMAIYNMDSNSYTKAFYYLQKIAEIYGKYSWMKEMVNEIPENYKTTEMKNF